MSKIVIIAGSNNKNLALANEFKDRFDQNHVESQVVDLVSLGIPLYTPAKEAEGIPDQVFEYKELFDQASGFVFAIPEYNGGIPPVVTNLIAWISRSGDQDWRKSFNGKPAALASFSGSGGFQVLISLRTQLAYIGLNVLGRQVRATFKEDLNLDDVKAVSELLLRDVKGKL